MTNETERSAKRINFSDYFHDDVIASVEEGLEDTAYRAIPAISSSLLKEFRKSSKHFLHAMTEKKEQTKAMLLGSAFHCLLLEPYEFNKRYKVMPDFGDLRVAKNKNAKKEFMEKNGDWVSYISHDENETLLSIADNFFLNELASELLDDVKTEVSLFYKEPSGLKIKSRVDALGSEYFVDLKTTRCAEPNFFNREIKYRGYLQQLAFYKRGLEMLIKGQKKKPILIACENVAPFNVTVFEFNSIDFHKLNLEISRDLELMAEAMKSLQFKPYTEATVEYDEFNYDKVFVDSKEEIGF